MTHTVGFKPRSSMKRLAFRELIGVHEWTKVGRLGSRAFGNSFTSEHPGEQGVSVNSVWSLAG